MRNQALAVHQKFVLLGLSAKDGMVLENQTLRSGSGLALKEESGGKTADSATDDHAVIRLPVSTTSFGRESYTPSRMVCPACTTSRVFPFDLAYSPTRRSQ